MSKVLIFPGTVLGRAHLNAPVDDKGNPQPQEDTENVTLTISPTTTLIQSGELRVLADSLHTEEFKRDTAVEIIVAPQGYHAAILADYDADIKATQRLGTANTSLSSQLTVATQRAESAEATVAVRDSTIKSQADILASQEGEISTLRAELTRAQNALATKPATEPIDTVQSTTETTKEATKVGA
jgi:hypothetical protein